MYHTQMTVYPPTSSYLTFNIALFLTKKTPTERLWQYTKWNFWILFNFFWFIVL